MALEEDAAGQSSLPEAAEPKLQEDKDGSHVSSSKDLTQTRSKVGQWRCGRKAAKSTRLRSLKWYHYVILTGFNMIGPTAQDMYLPSLQQVVDEFQTSLVMVGLTLQVNMVVCGLTGMVIGWLSDRIGRRPVVLFSLLINFIGSLLVATAPNLEVMLVGRAIQAIGESSSPIAPAIVQDVYDDPKTVMKVFAIFGGMRPACIVAAPMIGGPLAAGFGWRSIFWLLTGWSALQFLLSLLLLPETLRSKFPADDADDAVDGAAATNSVAAGDAKAVAAESLEDVVPVGLEEGGQAEQGGQAPEAAAAPVAEEAAAVGSSAPVRRPKLARLFCDRLATGLLFTFALIFCGVISMLSNFSFVLQGHFGVNTAVTGLLIGASPVMMFLSSALVGVLGKMNYSPLTALRLAMVLLGIEAACAFLVAAYGTNSLGLYLATMYGLTFTESFAMPSLNAIFLMTLKDMSGLATTAQDGMRSFACAAFALGSNAMTEHLGTAGALVSIGSALSAASILFWATVGLWPPATLVETLKGC